MAGKKAARKAPKVTKKPVPEPESSDEEEVTASASFFVGDDDSSSSDGGEAGGGDDDAMMDDDASSDEEEAPAALEQPKEKKRVAFAEPAAPAAAPAEAAEAEERCESCEAIGEAQLIMQEALELVMAQVPEQVRASDLMTKTIVSLSPDDTMEHALNLMNRMRKRAVPVVGAGEQLLGFLKYRDPIKAAQSGKGSQQVKAWMRRELLTVEPDTPFTEMEALLLEGTTGRLHVVDDDRRLLGLISRTDMLRHYRHYRDVDRRVV